MSDLERRPHERTPTVRLVGRSYCHITCPFCGERCRAFIWSLAGHGCKRCPGCRAKHLHDGTTEAPETVTKK